MGRSSRAGAGFASPRAWMRQHCQWAPEALGNEAVRHRIVGSAPRAARPAQVPLCRLSRSRQPCDLRCGGCGCGGTVGIPGHAAVPRQVIGRPSRATRRANLCRSDRRDQQQCEKHQAGKCETVHVNPPFEVENLYRAFFQRHRAITSPVGCPVIVMVTVAVRWLILPMPVAYSMDGRHGSTFTTRMLQLRHFQGLTCAIRVRLLQSAEQVSARQSNLCLHL